MQTFFRYCENVHVGIRTVARKLSLGGLYVCVGCFTFVPGGLDIENLIKSPMIHSVPYFDLRGLGTLFGGAKPTKSPRGDGTDGH